MCMDTWLWCLGSRGGDALGVGDDEAGIREGAGSFSLEKHSRHFVIVANTKQLTILSDYSQLLYDITSTSPGAPIVHRWTRLVGAKIGVIINYCIQSDFILTW